MYDEKFMKLAIAEAKVGIKNGHGGPFGAVVVRDGEVVASGHNCVLKNNDSTCHGEIDAIRKAEEKLQSYDLAGCEIYTTGEPCPMCLAAILWANIDKVYYGCTLEDNSRIGFRDTKIERIVRDRGGNGDGLSDSSEDDSKDKCRDGVRDGFEGGFVLEERGRKACLELFDEYNEIEGRTIY